MKKLAVVLTALTCCFLAYSQEVDVRIIPRVDVNTYVPMEKGAGWDVDFGNTSLYTLVDGTFLENFSYSVEAHWLSLYGYSVSDVLSGLNQYSSSLYSNSNNWLDWAKLSYNLALGENGGSLEFTAGKDVMAIGDYETDAYDFDSHFGINSLFWSYAPIYQWGGKIGYITPSEMTTIYFQATTSPYGGMMFRDQQYGAYGLQFYGDYDWYAPIWSTNFIQYDKKKYINVIALGNQFYAGDFTIGLDYTNRARTAKNFFNQEMSVMGTLSYNFADKFEVFGKVGYERFNSEGFFMMNPTLDPENADPFSFYEDNCAIYDDDDNFIGFDALPTDYIFGGVGMNWYPLTDNQDLRVHAVISANNWSNQLSVNLGVTYNFSVFSK